MYITHLIPRFPYYGYNSVVGGAANTLYNLVKQQSGKINYRILAQVPVEILESKPGYKSLNVIPLEIEEPPTSFRFGISYTFRILQAALKKDQSCNLVHGHSGYIDYVMSTALFAAIRRIPAIHSVYCPVVSTSKYRLVLQKIIVRVADPFIHTYIAISENTSRSLSKLGIAPQKIKVVHPIVDIVRFTPEIDQAEAKKKLGLNEQKQSILFVGSTKPVKNLETVLEAFSLVVRQIPDACLIITTELAHKDHDKRSTYLQSLINQLGVSNNVMQFGIVDNMPELMKAANVFVAAFLDTNGPSDFFQAALEAMAVGKPVVVSSVGAMPEIVNQEVGFLIDPTDKCQIASALLTILQNPSHSLHRGLAASKLIRTEFNPSEISNRISNLYEEALGKSK